MKVRLELMIDEDLRNKFKAAAAMRGMRMNELFEELIRDMGVNV